VNFNVGITARWSDRFFSGIPAWKRLIGRPLAKDERVSLFAGVFADRGETEVVKRLCGDEAQSFVNVIDEVLPNPTSEG